MRTALLLRRTRIDRQAQALVLATVHPELPDLW